MADRLCIDLCCGLGGFSRAFRDAGWEVVTVDINPKFKPTICADLTKLSFLDIIGACKKKDMTEYQTVVVLASPPCERFSIANSDWPQKGIRKALDIAGACIELIADLQPDYWCLENPKGRLRWFLGPPPHSVHLSDYGYRGAIQGGKDRKSTKPTDLWGNIPFPLLEASIEVKTRNGGSGNDPAQRADMSSLSQALLEATSPPERQGAQS